MFRKRTSQKHPAVNEKMKIRNKLPGSPVHKEAVYSANFVPHGEMVVEK